jgi:hypothetical protein
MAKGILIIGESGTGKSSSARDLDPTSTFIINVQGKPLPFFNNKFVDCVKGAEPKEGNVYYSDNVMEIKNVLIYISKNRPEIKTVVIDDFQYIAANMFMNRITEKGFDKFNDIGYGIWVLPKMLPELRADLNVYFFTHEESFITDEGVRKRCAKKMGKLIDQQVGGIEGFFTYVLFTSVNKDDEGIHHTFITNNDGDTTAKTPIGMFDDLKIPNNLTIINNKLN